ncbi:ABC transporter permease [Microbacterium aurantiacum]|uniref:ABC transporter permease n=1 Tax=Microbacterium aurantiacum TaxID=162393 RepID=A0ABT8FST0_9MICO|nr:ABC transporter permease [Microbacterium aurantiacum]MDN4464260.1 ABC transporter permease [Microbacterium aurantiacum]
MYGTYLRRELAGRKKQTAIVAAGMAVAIALVIVVNALAAGVRDAQDAALASVYGIGTDLTVAGAAAEPGERGGMFEFDQDAGATDADGGTTLSQSRLTTEPGRGTLDAADVDTVAGVSGVSGATGALSLVNMSFSGELPARPDDAAGEATGTPPGGTEGDAPAGGGGFGGGAFGVDSFTVLGIDPAVTAVGPLSAVAVDAGRALEATDAGAAVAVVDATYAASVDVAVGDDIEIGGTAFEVIGVVASTSSAADTAADVYIPLDVAQDLAAVGSAVSTVYVQAASVDDIGEVQAQLEEVLPEATISAPSDLAAGVSGSLSSASALIASLGTWLSVIALAVALILAVLLTVSGVTRRTGELGTLKALGWSDRRVVGQVAGESLVQGLLGGLAGLALGLGAIAVITAAAPTFTTTADSPPAGPGGQGGPAGFADAIAAQTEIVLTAPVTPTVIGAAIGIAVLGGLLAGVAGGWRAARLRPAEALRSAA